MSYEASGGRSRGTETRPFFLTSEFWGVAAMIAAVAVGAAVTDTLDERLLWPLVTALTIGFVFSRGLAKIDAPSLAWDPRETLMSGRGGAAEGSSRGGATSPARSEEEGARVTDMRYEEETRQMSTMQREEYGPQMGGPGYGPWGGGYGYGRGYGMRQQFPIETKPFFLTSEFWGSVALIVGLAIAAGTSDGIDDRLFWILATAITIGYVISRGIAKSGTKSRSWDPREEVMERVRGRAGSREGAASAG